ncbi:hypothetical protein OIU76_011726 [Salix suchowensis]|nr:hypothetical protein OIU76_011726 [Salix suchowensis]KAJ6356909.1 hypothetical protein OIU78_004910 [Salix suchowensis]
MVLKDKDWNLEERDGKKMGLFGFRSFAMRRISAVEVRLSAAVLDPASFSLMKEIALGICMVDATGSCEVMISFNRFLKEILVRD